MQVQEDLEAVQNSWREELVPMQLMLEQQIRREEISAGAQVKDVIRTAAELREDLDVAQQTWREELVSVQVALARLGREQEEDIDACNEAILNLSKLLGAPNNPSDDASEGKLDAGGINGRGTQAEKTR